MRVVDLFSVYSSIDHYNSFQIYFKNPIEQYHQRISGLDGIKGKWIANMIE